MATTATEKPLTIREVEIGDSIAVAELSGQLGYASSVEEVRDRIEAMQPLREDHLALVACAGDEVVGWIGAEIARHLQSAPHTLITGLVVKDSARSLGVGKQLCEAVEQWSNQKGISVIQVTSRMTRERAHRFYRREGFTQIKTSAVFEKILSS
ncbi:GNAT family N-acetyltransferase [Edaphobacter albus]|uniref:GNAT family N-acetyltransferase n=1 Tax=Edaphobacter sp. 4G125 TaxID=2763071 RepID=UPI001645F983|nr:GNAT family N-acetyltransferase [Edaphobacter sp. 4G125]QNI36532.1 GNAT family N-acetyltransferase [Edaphobacter sp. 4G125]